MTRSAMQPRLIKHLSPLRWQRPKTPPMGRPGYDFTVDTIVGTPGEWCRIIVSHGDGSPLAGWIHASISYPRSDRMPDYDDLVLLHKACFPGFAYQVFAPPAKHINITPNVLHLWGRSDGQAAMPDFGSVLGSI